MLGNYSHAAQPHIPERSGNLLCSTKVPQLRFSLKVSRNYIRLQQQQFNSFGGMVVCFQRSVSVINLRISFSMRFATTLKFLNICLSTM